MNPEEYQEMIQETLHVLYDVQDVFRQYDVRDSQIENDVQELIDRLEGEVE